MARKRKFLTTKHTTDPASRRMVVYFRHSIQKRRKESLRRQRDEVRRWAKRNGIEITKEFIEREQSNPRD